MTAATATIGRRMLLSFAPLVILWGIVTIFIHMNLDNSHDTAAQQVPPFVGRRQQQNPLDAIRDRVTRTDHGRFISGRAFTAGSKPRGGVSTSFRNLQSLINQPLSSSRGDRLLRGHRIGFDAIEDRKRRPLSRVRHLINDVGDKPMVMEPKNYDTQGQATVCVYRDRTSNFCQLHRCGSVGDGNDHNKSQLNDYGFVLHERNNTRGRLPVLSGGRGCAVSHRYKFVYVHVQKSGGMTVKTILKRGLCGGEVAQTCDDLEIYDCNSAISAFPHYFVFSFVRNPFSRMYSAYSMAETMKRRDSHPVSFDEFATMTRVQRLIARKLADSHYDLQIKFLMDSSHCPVVDFVGRLERFQDDMQIVINQIQSPDLQAFFTASGGKDLVDNCTNFGERKKLSELGGNLRNAYQSQATIDAIAKEFEFDFKLLGYDPTQVP